MKTTLLLVSLFAAGTSLTNAATFDEICSQSTTMFCYDFETTDYIRYEDDPDCRNDPYLASFPSNANQVPSVNTTIKYNSTAGCVFPLRSTDASVSGNYSMKLRYPWGIGSNPSGNFSPYLGLTMVNGEKQYVQVGRGGDLWVRYKIRFTDGLANVSKDSAGRYYPINSSNISSEKQTAIKVLMAEGPNNDVDSIFTLGRYTRLVHGYGVGGSGGEQFTSKDQVGCDKEAQPTFPDGSQTVNLPCKKFIPNTWHTIQFHIKYADNATFDNGITEIFIDDNPQPSIQAINVSHSDKGTGPDFLNQPYYEGPLGTVSRGVFKVQFTLFTTNKWKEQVHPEQAMYIDDLILSKTKVPPLDGQSDFVAPAAPRDLQIQQ